MLVHAAQLVHGIVDVQHRRAFADAEHGAHLPGRLAIHGPTQGLQFTRRQGRTLGLQFRRHQEAHRRFLRMHGEELQVGHDTLQFIGVGGQRAVTVDAEQEVFALGQVQRHRNAGAITELRLLLPQVTDSVFDVGVLVPDDGHRLAFAVLQHGVALATRSVHIGLCVAGGGVVHHDQIALAAAVINHRDGGNRLEAELPCEAHHFIAELLTAARLQHRCVSTREHRSPCSLKYRGAWSP